MYYFQTKFHNCDKADKNHGTLNETIFEIIIEHACMLSKILIKAYDIHFILCNQMYHKKCNVHLKKKRKQIKPNMSSF